MVKLVINSKNESVNYNAQGEESGGSQNNTYNVVSDSGEVIGSVNVSNSYNFYSNSNDGSKSSITEINQKLKEAFETFNTSITE